MTETNTKAAVTLNAFRITRLRDRLKEVMEQVTTDQREQLIALSALLGQHIGTMSDGAEGFANAMRVMSSEMEKHNSEIRAEMITLDCSDDTCPTHGKGDTH